MRGRLDLGLRRSPEGSARNAREIQALGKMSHPFESYNPLPHFDSRLAAQTATDCRRLQYAKGTLTKTRFGKGYPYVPFLSQLERSDSYARDSLTRSLAASLHASQTVLPFALGFVQQT
jgi:hypothetical protein